MNLDIILRSNRVYVFIPERARFDAVRLSKKCRARRNQGFTLIELAVVLFIVGLLIAGLLGNYLLKIILRPLNDIAAQAAAIGEKHFSTIPEPATAEFRPIAAAINNLSLQVNSSMKQQAVQPQNSHRQSHVDKVSGLLNRDQFLKVLATDLKQNDTSADIKPMHCVPDQHYRLLIWHHRHQSPTMSYTHFATGRQQ